MVRTPGFHPGNRGSIPLGATSRASSDKENELLHFRGEAKGNLMSKTKFPRLEEDSPWRYEQSE